jgi:propanediol utilization protein
MEQQNIEQIARQVMGRIFVELEASARHVYLTQAQAKLLFGHDLTPDRPLSQPGQFLAKERLSLVGPRGELAKVAVLGPARKEAQVELSHTDARALGLKPPVRDSGDVANTPGLTLRSALGTLPLDHGVIIARRHLHMTPEDAAHFGVRDKQLVKLQTFTDRPVIFEDVLIRVHRDFATRAHLDFDEANACAMEPGDLGRILL